jgi:two-component system, NtrC family, response regulator AtoC
MSFLTTPPRATVTRVRIRSAMAPGLHRLADMQGAILVVDDEVDTRELLVDALTRRGFEPEAVASADEALVRLRDSEFDAIVTDLRLGGMNGIELCQRICEARPDLPAIVITGHADMDVAIAAIRAGAYDLIAKPISTDALALALGRAVHHRQLTSEVKRLREQVVGTRSPISIVGDSQEMQKVVQLVDQVADSDATVLITGESGTGKELVARALHDRSSRAKGPFVAVNCAAMPASLLESELFGHVRGAFTDAKKSRPGLFVQAVNGTLFLDEIGEMPLEMQVKLLRVLQERKVRPVGSDEEVPFDVRLVTATNRDLQRQVDDGHFRADLFYRINVVRVEIPPLRARQADILALAQHFLRRHAERNGKPVVGISPPAARKMLDYEWPGNVRELENCIERAVALTRLTEITVDDLPEGVRSFQSTRLAMSGEAPELLTLDEMERRYIRRVLLACNGNKSQAARVLGLDRRSLYRRLDSLRVGPDGGDGQGGSQARADR